MPTHLPYCATFNHANKAHRAAFKSADSNTLKDTESLPQQPTLLMQPQPSAQYPATVT